MLRIGVFVLFIFFFYSCSEFDKSKNKNITGKWEIIYISETDGRDLPRGVLIEFYDDGTFISKNNHNKEIAEGNWEIENNNSVLHLEGESDIEDISEWNLKIAGYSMSWIGAKNTNEEDIELKFAKIINN